MLSACLRNSLADLRKIIADGKENASAIDEESGLTPLVAAAGKGHTKVLEFLVQECGVQLSDADAEGNTPLHAACEGGHLEAARSIVEMVHADQLKELIDCVNDDGETPLHLACSNGHVDVVHFLLGKGADRLLADQGGEIPLHASLSVGVMRLLLLDGKQDLGKKQTNWADDEGRTPLYTFAYEGRTEAVALLLETGAEADAQTKSGNSPLHCSATFNNFDIAKMLVQRGASPLLQNAASETPLGLAVKHENARVARMFLNEMSVLDTAAAAWKKESSSGLFLAAFQNQDLAMVDLLLSHGMDPAAKDSGGNSAVHHACRFSGPATISCLTRVLGAGREGLLCEENACGSLPMHFSSVAGSVQVVKFIVERLRSEDEAVRQLGAATDEDGNTPLRGACLAGNVPLVKFIVGFLKKARTPLSCYDVCNNEGRGPLDEALVYFRKKNAVPEWDAYFPSNDNVLVAFLRDAGFRYTSANPG